jgi:aminobenzoyl-glutamate utilization protein A
VLNRNPRQVRTPPATACDDDFGPNQMTLPLPITTEMIRLRRDFHRHPELGFCEFRTAAIVAGTLEKLGWKVTTGRDVMSRNERMDVPPAAEIDAAVAEALRDGAEPDWVEHFRDGLTGVVGL